MKHGRLVRELLLGALGGQAVHLVEPTVPVFADATATSVITCFRPGTVPEAIRMRQVAGPADLGALAGGSPGPHGRPPRRLPLGAAAPRGHSRAGAGPAEGSRAGRAGGSRAGRAEGSRASRAGGSRAGPGRRVTGQPGRITGSPGGKVTGPLPHNPGPPRAGPGPPPAAWEASRTATSSWVNCAASTAARSRARTRCG